MTALYSIGDFVGYVERRVTIAPLPKLWYMLKLHPNYDLKAERQLHERGVSAYVPKETRSKKTVWNRKVLRDVPIFPGAMFIPDFEANLPKLKTVADGIGGFVRTAGEPLRISLSWMDKIRAFEAKVRETAGDRKFEVGQCVRIIGGQFDMWEGQIFRLDRHARLKVLLTILEREVPVEFNEDEVEAVSEPKAAPRQTREVRASSRRAQRLAR